MRKIIYLSNEEKKREFNKIVVNLSYKAIIIFFIFAAFAVFGLFKVNNDNVKKYRAVYYSKRDEIKQLKHTVACLEKRIEELNTPEGIEKEARAKLGMVKEGEKILRPFSKKNNKNN